MYKKQMISVAKDRILIRHQRLQHTLPRNYKNTNLRV